MANQGLEEARAAYARCLAAAPAYESELKASPRRRFSIEAEHFDLSMQYADSRREAIPKAACGRPATAVPWIATRQERRLAKRVNDPKLFADDEACASFLAQGQPRPEEAR